MDFSIIKILITNPLLLLCGAMLLGLYLFDSLYIKPKFTPGKRLKKHKAIKNNLKVTTKTKACGIIFGLILWGRIPTQKVFYSPYNDEGHILCVGGSGMGKTSALLIPTLNSWDVCGGTSFVIDISGDIYKNAQMKNKLKYEPANKKSIPYNIFGYIDRLKDDESKDKALAKLALLIMPNPVEQNSSSGEKYYTKTGRKMLTAALIAFYHQGKDFIEICIIINQNSWRNLLNKIDETGNESAIAYINDLEGVEDRYLSEAKDSCGDAISIFVTDSALRSNIRRPKKKEPVFEPCKIEKNNVFICIPDDELEYYSPLTMILTSQCLDFFATRSLNAKHQILFCLDEASSLGAIDILPPLKKFRKRKIRLFVLTQALADIDLTWGKEQRKSMMTNFKYKIVLESSEPDEQEYWARLIGKEITTSMSATTGVKSSNTLSENKDYIIDPYELANLGKDLIVLYPGGYRRLRKNYYYKKSFFSMIMENTLIEYIIREFSSYVKKI